MELKDYQSRVIKDLTDFLSYLEELKDIRAAFRTYWDDRGATRMEAYKNNVPGVPHVCVKVPTAGGKTFLAANALKPIFDVVVPESTGQPRVVVWLVPSLTILEQTERNFADPTHPYRQRLNTHFKGRVEIYGKKSLLQGAGFSPDAIQGQLSLILMSFDSLRARNKDDRKIFQENGNLATFDVLDADLLESADPTALINVIRALRPVVVVDESHNAESDLSVEMLVNLKPSFILDLTATPRNNSNIVSFVDALALKKECMVKLPVIVYNRPDKTEVVNNSLQLRRKLETLAIAEEKITGKYIRPIILFQAEPKTGEEKETFQKIKATLVKLKIPEAQIAIKTADVNELKGVDLMSRDCPVRYIITVNALKEGWDCPFAYILASLADKSSAVDVEQVVGRVLRQPHVVAHQEPLLNMSYVFTASNRFMDTLDKVVKGLNRAGFSDRDYRAVLESAVESKVPDSAHPDLFAPPPPAVPEAPATTEYPTVEEEIDVERLQGCVADGGTTESESAGQPAVEPDTTLEQLTAHATEANQEFTKKAKDADSSLSPDLEARMNRYPIKSIYLEEARAIAIPQFFIQVPAGGFFDEAEKLALLEKENLLKDFRLSTCDTSLNFEGIDAEAYRVDLEQTGKDDYRPSFKKIDSRQKALLNAHILSLPRDSQVKNMAARLAEMIGNMYPIADREILAYIKRIMEGLTAEQLHDCLERDYSYVAKIKQKISELSTDYCEKVFGDWLTTEKIVTSPSFKLPEFIAPNLMGPTIANSLYMSEKKANGFEERVINDIANLPNIQFWHRNIEKSGFRINGFINHYPDFIIRTISGKIIILETKGDDRDNSDSVRKLKLSNAWEKQAGRQFRYFMVFENKPIDGAHKLADALGLLGQL
ncbi:DEAD/DEAH box helicase [Citrifermentans pelophilum]|nr:DEAD/DEAH box helicase family protein [Geoanaerobacter pelophilus]